MSIPETALVMMNDRYSTDTVAYRDWQTLRGDLSTLFPDAAELDALEAQPEAESQIYRADLINPAGGLYMTDYSFMSSGHKCRRRSLYRIQWDADGMTGHVEFVGEPD